MSKVSLPVRALVAFVLVLASLPLLARQGEPPYTLSETAKSAIAIPLVTVAPIDAAQRRVDEANTAHAKLGVQAKSLRVADGRALSIRPERDGAWQTLADGRSLWRVRVSASGATEVHVGFSKATLPTGAKLYVIGAAGYYQGPYSLADTTAGEFWSPVVSGDTATIELQLPPGTALGPNQLELSYLGAGFRDLFGRAKGESTGPGTSGACNVNVACPVAIPYDNEVRAVAHIQYDLDGSTYICTATLLADAPHDYKNYLLTAAHCFSTQTSATTLVAYWNYEAAQCSSFTGYTLLDSQTGSLLRATRADADFTLVELSTAPDPSWNVYYAGVDASGAAPAGSVGIHHPRGDVKKITINTHALSTTDNCIGTGGTSANTHWYVGPYAQGTTQGGSSGSGLFVPVGDRSGHAKLLIGTLSGGDAECDTFTPTQPNNGADCYGKVAVGWNGPSADSRLRDWLDPQSSGATQIAGIDAPSTQVSTATPELANRAAAERGGAYANNHAGTRRSQPRALGARTQQQ